MEKMKKAINKSIFMSFILILIWQFSYAHLPLKMYNKQRHTEENKNLSLRETCDQPIDKWYQNINNVRAILTSGGDVWTENAKGRYIVPKKENSADEVSSLYSGAVWIGGKDASNNIKLAASDYRSSSEYDFYSGPLDLNGATSKDVCIKWDKHFKVLGSEIDLHIASHDRAVASGNDMNCDSIPDGVKFWPAKGNPYFYTKYQFSLPPDQDLAPFYDQNEDSYYDPCDGDYPIIHIEAPAGIGVCPKGVYADEMFFWVYNDAGGSHKKTKGLPIQMEVQVEAFAWATNDEINDMTFQRYKLINKANSDIKDCYFAWWVDPDLGCFTDDYVGCVPPPVNLMYTYNIDAQDGSDGCTCTRGVTTYCDNIPIIGVDYFRGPTGHFNFKFEEIYSEDGTLIRIDTTLVPIGVDEEGDTSLELGMSSFIYFLGEGAPVPGMSDPSTTKEYYNYLTGFWKDGTKITKGGSGYNLNSTDTVKYVFPDAPDIPGGWSMYQENLPAGDRRTIQATGPFVLKPGDVNELIIGVPWVPNQNYPGPNLKDLLAADQLAQALFDNCFELQDGPDAPDIDIVELDRQLILVLSNDSIFSNNKFENFKEVGIKIDKKSTDSIYYHFEGYQVYQLYNGNVSAQELDDPTKARLIFQSDFKNGINKLYNWTIEDNPSPGGSGKFFSPTLKVSGADDGLKHVFNFTQDQFAKSNKDLINHKPYYFMVVSYEANNWAEFDLKSGYGQREPFFPGRRNVKIYKGVPRPIEYEKFNTQPFDGPEITRIEGTGVGNNFVNLSQKSLDEILANNIAKELVFKEGYGPFKVEIFNPYDIKENEYQLEFFDKKMSDNVLDSTAYWKLTNLTSGKVFKSNMPIINPNEQVIVGEGFTVKISQAPDVATLVDADNGIIGSSLTYKDDSGVNWFLPVGDDSGVSSVRIDGQTVTTFDVTNFLKTNKGEIDETKDPNRAFNKRLKEVPFAPFALTDFASSSNYYVSPSARSYMNSFRNNVCFVNKNNCLKNLNNVDIVFTSDKSKWSRCVVIETSVETNYQSAVANGGVLAPEGNAKQFQLRQAPSVGKDDSNSDGLPDADGDGVGMGWFPGYAIDMETGQRLNIFFGEASVYGGKESIDTLFLNKKATGRDMMFNPSPEIAINFPENLQLNFPDPWQFAFGSQHMVYVTNTAYDRCDSIRVYLKDPIYKNARKAMERITWSGLVMSKVDSKGKNPMLSYKDGLIPNDCTVKLRVNNPYQIADATKYPFLIGARNGYGTYKFNFNGKANQSYEALNKENPLDAVNVVPNPYYAYSAYETSQFTKQVKITNLPAKCTITIYSIDGKFIRQFKRDERPVVYTDLGRSNPPIKSPQVYPDLIWDLNNHKGIPVASGVYLIHIAAEDMQAERTIKWFGINREFDPTGL